MPRVVPSQVVALIDRMFPFAKLQQEVLTSKRERLHLGHSVLLAGLIQCVKQIPPELLRLDGDDHAALIASIAAIEDSIATWATLGGIKTLERITGFGDLNPVTLIRRSLSKCSDEFPSPQTAELPFVPDDQLREELRIDISAANGALSNGEWKAATVLAGSVIEALLLWALEQCPEEKIEEARSNLTRNGKFASDPGSALEGWSLHHYIEVAFEMKVIKERTAIQARLAKDFRNLMHPGRSKRLGQKCDRPTALAAAAAMEMVVQDLTEFMVRNAPSAPPNPAPPETGARPRPS